MLRRAGSTGCWREHAWSLDQAPRIPRELELDGDEAVIHRQGDRPIVEPVRKGKLIALLAELEPLDEEFPDLDEGLAPLDDAELGE